MGTVSSVMNPTRSNYNLGFSLDSSLKPDSFPHKQPHAVDKTKRPPSACKIGLIIVEAVLI